MHVKSCRPSFWYCIVLMGWGFVIVALITSSFRKMKSVTPSEMDHHQQHPKLVTWPKVVLFGDSLTQYSMNPNHGWATILAHSLQRRCDVIVRGFSGYNTIDARHLLPRIANTFDGPVAAVVIFLGTNDAADAVQNVRQHVPLEEYRKNLAWMVKFMQDKGVPREKIILMSPPAADVKKWTRNDRSLAQTEAYARVCEEVAHGANISSINLCKLMQDKFKNGSWTKLLEDGIHFSTEGNIFVAEELLPLVKHRMNLHEELFPSWNALSPGDPEGLMDSWTPLKPYHS